LMYALWLFFDESFNDFERGHQCDFMDRIFIVLMFYFVAQHINQFSHSSLGGDGFHLSKIQNKGAAVIVR